MSRTSSRPQLCALLLLTLLLVAAPAGGAPRAVLGEVFSTPS
jgi:hypothetical protein